MNLDEAQKRKVTGWIDEGLKLAEIQKRLETDLGLRVTYMELRFLLDDLRLTPKDQAPPAVEKNLGAPSSGASSLAGGSTPSPAAQPSASQSAPAPGKVAVTVDTVTRAGALVSGHVTFSDGQGASWYLDQMGRLGLSAKQAGYRPSPADLEEFQLQLQEHLQRLGY